MHGGLSPQLRDWEQVRHVHRPLDPPNPSLLFDLLWADPQDALRGWRPSRRGASFAFGEDVVRAFCSGMNVDLIVR